MTTAKVNPRKQEELMEGKGKEGGRRGKVMLAPPALPPTLAIPREASQAPEGFPRGGAPLALSDKSQHQAVISCLLTSLPHDTGAL